MIILHTNLNKLVDRLNIMFKVEWKFAHRPLVVNTSGNLVTSRLEVLILLLQSLILGMLRHQLDAIQSKGTIYIVAWALPCMESYGSRGLCQNGYSSFWFKYVQLSDWNSENCCKAGGLHKKVDSDLVWNLIVQSLLRVWILKHLREPLQKRSLMRKKKNYQSNLIISLFINRFTYIDKCVQ